MTDGPAARESLSVVVPVFNEERNVDPLYERLAVVLDSLDLGWEIIFSLDPSSDATEARILELRGRDPRVKLLRFFAQVRPTMATLAGLEAASGDAVVVIDCDLQDPPELMGSSSRNGTRATTSSRTATIAKGRNPRERAVANRLPVIKRIAEVEIPPHTGDFRLMSRRVVQNVIRLSEHHGFLRGLVALVGFRQTGVLYDRQERAGGSGKYNRFTGSLVIGLNGIVGFSRIPPTGHCASAPLRHRRNGARRHLPRLQGRRRQVPRGKRDIVILVSF